MRSARPLLRLLTAILRVVAFVVMVPVLAQAHAAHDHAGRAEGVQARSVGVPLVSVEMAKHAAASALVTTKARSDRSDCPGCQNCCCGHAFVAASDHDAVRGDRLTGRRVEMGPDSARPGAVPEAIPEPPRPFA